MKTRNNHHKNRRGHRANRNGREHVPATPRIIGAQLVAIPDDEPTIEITQEKYDMLVVAASTVAMLSNMLENNRYVSGDTIRMMLNIPEPKEEDHCCKCASVPVQPTAPANAEDPVKEDA